MSSEPRLPSLNGLRAFDAAGRLLSFRAAADELGVTQGAVAQQVRGLEVHLGLPLFVREPRGLSLTAEGRSYHPSVAAAFAALREATTALRPAPGHVTISVTPTFASKWLIPRIGAFSEAHPGIDLRITATERVSSFHSDGIDLAVRQGRPPFGASLLADLLFRQEVVAVCSPKLVEGLALPLGAADLEGLTLLHDTHDLWPGFLDAVFGGAVRPRRGLRLSQTTLSLDAALAGQGIALASRFLVERDLTERRLVRPIDRSLDGTSDFYVLAPRKTLSKAAEHVRTWLLGAAG